MKSAHCQECCAIDKAEKNFKETGGSFRASDAILTVI